MGKRVNELDKARQQLDLLLTERNEVLITLERAKEELEKVEKRCREKKRLADEAQDTHRALGFALKDRTERMKKFQDTEQTERMMSESALQKIKIEYDKYAERALDAQETLKEVVERVRALRAEEIKCIARLEEYRQEILSFKAQSNNEKTLAQQYTKHRKKIEADLDRQKQECIEKMERCEIVRESMEQERQALYHFRFLLQEFCKERNIPFTYKVHID